MFISAAESLSAVKPEATLIFDDFAAESLSAAKPSSPR